MLYGFASDTGSSHHWLTCAFSQIAGLLRSTRVTRLHRYYEPVRPFASHQYWLLMGPPLGVLPSHRSDRFPRSAQEPELGSRRLHAGHHSSSKQVSLELSPEPTTGARFR